MSKELDKLLSCVRAYMDSVYEDECASVQELARSAMFLALVLYDKAREKEKK